MIKKRAKIFSIGLLLFLLAGCSQFNISSRWKEKEIKIDGDDSDWNGSMQKYGKVSMASYNDKDYLYICLTSIDGKILSLLTGDIGSSLITRFFIPGKNNIIFGLKFSEGFSPTDKNFFKGFENSTEPRLSEDKPDDKNDRSLKPENQIKEKNKKIEVMIGDRSIGEISKFNHVEACLNIDKDIYKVVIEMKVPLTSSVNNKLAVNLFPEKAVKTICISIEATQASIMKKPGSSGPGMGNPPAGGRPPQMGGGDFKGGPGGGGPGGAPGGNGGGFGGGEHPKDGERPQAPQSKERDEVLLKMSGRIKLAVK